MPETQHIPAFEPSSWITRFAPLIAQDAHILDVACGSGRHTKYFLEGETRVTAVDIDTRALAAWAGEWLESGALELIEADLEAGPWPLSGRQFDGVIVSNFLWRPILADILGSVAPGGILIYETFGQGNEAHRRPTNPDYLLAPGELLAAADDGFEVLSYEFGLVDRQPKAVVSRICAVKDGGAAQLDLNED
ncbi:MAG: class I SAM-dependent methyltransferase [Alphaproteobacteria bacterium]|nr:class I SAM-dependent methyltransferase [Alphaproteobacteria bacterium]MCZ6764456.1 class I SAM-dependent methyltransferase [Alphaproteobacteria bacterium]